MMGIILDVNFDGKEDFMDYMLLDEIFREEEERKRLQEDEDEEDE